MQILKKYSACLMLLLLIIATVALVLPVPAHGDDIKSVNVVNTPLPVTGNVNANVSGNVNAAVSGNVGIVGTPTVLAQQSGPWNVGISGNTSATPLFVQNVGSQPTLVSDGKAFSLPPNPNIAFEFAVPSTVVLTDVQLSLNAPSLASTIFVSDGGTQKTYVFQTVGSEGSTWAGSTGGQAMFHFQSVLRSASGFRVGIYCNNIGLNAIEPADLGPALLPFTELL